MQNSQTSQQVFSQNFPGLLRLSKRFCHGKVGRRLAASASSLLLGLMISYAGGVRAQTGTTAATEAPPELTEALAQIDAAASQQNLRTVMRFYSPNFTTSDGLTYRTLEAALRSLWERYPSLTYQTSLNSWERDGTAIVAQTTTTITGTQALNGRDFTLTATLGSRQRFEGQQIVRQEVLTEQSQLTTGENPPTLQVSLPEQVVIGRDFTFDAIVQEPLGDRLLLGAAVEEPVRPNGHTNSLPIDLELLSAGGLFKVGRAPALLDSRWISAVIIREDGMTLETRRLRVVGRE